MCTRLSGFRKWSVILLGMICFYSGKNSPPFREFKAPSSEALCEESCQKPILELTWEIELHQVVACALRASPSYAGAPGNRGHFWTHLQSWKALIRSVTKNWVLLSPSGDLGIGLVWDNHPDHPTGPTFWSHCWNPLQTELNYLGGVLSCSQDDIRWF